MNVTGQRGAAALVAPAFGAGVATLDTETKADIFMSLSLAAALAGFKIMSSRQFVPILPIVHL